MNDEYYRLPMLIVGVHRSIHPFTAHPDLGESTGSILGGFWAYLVLPASRFGCPFEGMRDID